MESGEMPNYLRYSNRADWLIVPAAAAAGGAAALSSDTVESFHRYSIKLCPREAQTCTMLFCHRDLDINLMTLNSKVTYIL